MDKLKVFLQNFEHRVLSIFDGLILLSASYADSTEMSSAQDEFYVKNEAALLRKSRFYHEHPMEVPERQKDLLSKKEKAEQIELGTSMLCKNWGCGQGYQYSEDSILVKKACQHHPGSYQLGSATGLWPESWTCCRKAWDSKGCIRGEHRGVPEKKFTRLCLNTGEINPSNNRPDSACGKRF